MKAYSFAFDTRTLTITKDFAEKANNPKSAECQIIKAFQADFPTMKIKQRTHRTPAKYHTAEGEVLAHNKRKGITYERMERFIDRSAQLCERLINGDVDMVVCIRSVVDPAISTIHLMTDRLCMVVPHKFLQIVFPENTQQEIFNLEHGGIDSIQLFHNFPFMIPKGTRISSATDVFLANSFEIPNILINTASSETLLELCYENLGITFSFEMFAHKSLSAATRLLGYAPAHIIPIGIPELHGDLIVGHRAKQPLSKAEQAFVDITKQVLSQEMYL